MAGHERVGYNTKGRQSTAGLRKKGKKKKMKSKESLETQDDGNASILVQKPKEEKEKERKEKLLQELAAQSESKWNAKKKKRLEKYIDKKLKKEERVQIFEKLAQSQASLSSVLLQSSSTLGTGKLATHQELFEKSDNKQIRRTLNANTGKRKRAIDFQLGDRDESSQSDDDTEMEDIEVGNHEDKDESNIKRPIVVLDDTHDPSRNPTPIVHVVGGALQRNPDGSLVAPKVRHKPVKTQTSRRRWEGLDTPQVDMANESDSSFDSSDSVYDTSDEDDEGVEDSAPESQSDQKEPETAQPKIPKLGFKAWAVQQLNSAKGHQTLPASESSSLPSSGISAFPPIKKRKLEGESTPVAMRGPLGEDIKVPGTTLAQRLLAPDCQNVPSSTRVKTVEVRRLVDVEEARLLLPIISEEQPIMEAVLLHPVVIICGETGSGKTTQVPQFLYEAGFGTAGSDNPGMIGITQPRRVAAISMAARVAHELSLTSSRVSYQIRYDATVSAATSIKFMTDGVLLRELANDFLLSKYSVIIIDEAHERSMNTDILIGVLSRVIKLRENMWKDEKEGAKPLRLIIMSATLRVSDFAENTTLFPSPPPIINVAARQHPVTFHFSRRTNPDYLKEAMKKATKIHTRLPPGGILVFLTGQNEITGFCRKLKARFGKKPLDHKQRNRRHIEEAPDPTRKLNTDTGTVSAKDADVEPEDVDIVDAYDDVFSEDNQDEVDEDPEALDSDDEQTLNEELGLDVEDSGDVPMHVVPLYSLLPSEEQKLVFQPPPAGSRLVVVSTNVAETSLTIPGIRYVVDCGRAKERHYDLITGIQSFRVAWISKASAAQRAGRAGRTGPGHCYRLYSSAFYEHHFDPFSRPEINRMPIEGVVLQMKSMHIDAVVNFPFPTPPDRVSLRKAEKTLLHLGALSPATLSTKMSSNITSDSEVGQISELGRTMALFPLPPRFSRMLVIGQQHGCLPYVISVVSALSIGDPFLYEETIGGEVESGSDSESDGAKDETTKTTELRRMKRKAFFKSQHLHASLGKFTSDALKMLSVVGAYEYAGGSSQFCEEHFVRPKAMDEIHKLRAQISKIVQMNFPGLDVGFVSKLKPPSDLQIKVLKQILTAGFIDQIAVRKDCVDPKQASGDQYKTSKGVPYRALGVSEDVFIHPSSLLMSGPPPNYVVFHEVIRTSRVYIRGLTVINPAWLPSLGKPLLCTFSKPYKNNAGTSMVIPRFGPENWELPAIKAESVGIKNAI